MSKAKPAPIPDKPEFKIGEVSRITGIKPHVLRFWEGEFPSLKPRKSDGNQRVYRRRDVETVLTLKQLLYQEGFTIAGANKKLRELRQGRPAEPELLRQSFDHLRHELQALIEIVDGDAGEDEGSAA